MKRKLKIMEYILLIVGFGFLIKGANYFVEGAPNKAKILKIPPILIGLTVVTFGTRSIEFIILKVQHGNMFRRVVKKSRLILNVNSCSLHPKFSG